MVLSGPVNHLHPHRPILPHPALRSPYTLPTQFTGQELAALLVAISFAAGLNVYATVGTLGLLAHTSLLTLPPGLHLLANWWIIATIQPKHDSRRAAMHRFPKQTFTSVGPLLPENRMRA